MGRQRRRRAVAPKQDRPAPRCQAAGAGRRGDGTMKPLALLDARAGQFVLLDIDDTLTTHGKLGVQAYGALEALQRAGKKGIPVTGRPAGGCDPIARMWPGPPLGGAK